MSVAVQFFDVWQKATEQDQADASALWKAEKAIGDDAVIAQRLPQLCVLARDGDGALVAITTAYREDNARLKNAFYVMRMYVAEAGRRSGIGFQLLHEVIQALERRYVSGEDRSAIGLLFELENSAIQQAHPEAIWPTTGFVYIGDNERGAPMRVRYFEGARIV